MVKITDMKETNKINKPTPKEPTEQYKNTNPTKKQKYNNISIRLTDNILNQLNLYAEQTQQSKTNIITELINNKFENKRITRDHFNLNKPTQILIPKTFELTKQYIDKKINLLVDVYQKQDKTTLQPYTKQELLYNNFEQDLQIMTIEQINNSLDVWDNIEQCYYNTYNLQNPANKTKNHLGLIIIDQQKTNNKLFVLVQCYKNKLCSATIITLSIAIDLAIKTDNIILLDYLENQQEIKNIQSVHDQYKKEQEYKQTIQQLQQENKELKEQKYKYDTDILNNLSNENQQLKKQIQQYKKLENLVKELYNIDKE